MKYTILLSCLFFFGNLSTQTPIFLSDSISVSPDNTYGYRAPRIALLENDRPVVYWGKPNGELMYLAFWQGTGFSDPVEVNTGAINADLWGGGLGPQIASYGNTIFLVFEEYGEGIYVIRSSDGGVNFDIPVSVHDFPPGRVGTLPSISVTETGNPIVSFVTTNFQEQDAQYEISISNDGGMTFEPAVVANLSVLSGEVCECCPASVSTTSSEEILLAFRNNESNIRDIWVSKSVDGGLSFPEVADIDETDWLLNSCPTSGPQSIISGDSLFTVYYSAGAGSPNVYLSTLHIPSMQKGIQIEIPTTSGQPQNQNFPRIAGNLDTIGMVWQESQQIGTDVIFAFSTNGTSNLTEELYTVGAGNLSQNYPDIAYSNGVFHIVYQDQLTQQVWYRKASFEPISNLEHVDLVDIDFQVFPNPASNKVSILSQKPFSNAFIQVFNSYGQLLMVEEKVENQIDLDLSIFPEGIYWINISNDVSNYLTKLLILK